MRIIRYLDQKGIAHTGWTDGELVGKIDGSIYAEYKRNELSIPFRKVKILPPSQPSKIICVGRNYTEHAKERNADLPALPLLFLKPPSALIASGSPIMLPIQSQQVDYEGELAIVIKTRCKGVPSEQVKDLILGYSIANDVTARDLQSKDLQWTRAKGFDTFCPLGPWIETEVDPYDLLLSTYVNGVLRQMASTKDMIFPINHLIAYISSIMTLEPGDVILTGTPAGIGTLTPNDSVKISIEGIGELINSVEQGE